MIKSRVLSRENLRGIVRQRSLRVSKFCCYRIVWLCHEADSSSKIFHSLVCLFIFSTMPHNDRGYGRPAVCGSLTVAKRNSECGRKTCGTHVSQQANIGVCYGVVICFRVCFSFISFFNSFKNTVSCLSEFLSSLIRTVSASWSGITELVISCLFFPFVLV